MYSSKETEDILDIDLNVQTVNGAPTTLSSYPETTTTITSSEETMERDLDIENIDIVSTTLTSYPETTPLNTASKELKHIIQTDIDLSLIHI